MTQTTVQAYSTGRRRFESVVRCGSCGTYETVPDADRDAVRDRMTADHAVCAPEPCGCHWSLNLGRMIRCNRHHLDAMAASS